ncbi:pyridoxal-phosphate dependent enzyme [Streptomyces tricolor]|nr:pyridoxal-phosphate dependent enzyme [Streptomyces tricolor]
MRENLQRTGSFKLRGAYVRTAGLLPEGAGRRGRHRERGQPRAGVALASPLLGVHATVFMPKGAPLPKISATRDYGAEVRLHGQVVDESAGGGPGVRGRDRCGVHPPLRPPGRDRRPGHGRPGDFGAVLGGAHGRRRHGRRRGSRPVSRWRSRRCGRTSGSSACRRRAPPAHPPSLAAGRPVSLENPATMADGIKVGRPGVVPFGLVGELVDEVRTVSEDQLSAALLLCLERAKLVVEPAGASPVAALLAAPDAFEGPVVAVLSGGNVDPVLHAAGAAARHGRAGPLPGCTAAADGPSGRARHAPRGAVGGRRQRPRREPRPHRSPARALPRPRWSCTWRRRARRTVPRSAGPLRDAGYTVMD